jgi:hypothetical protein
LAKVFASVLIDTYNHERFIEKAIVSVLEQDFAASDREIVVVDDGSTDRTPEIVKAFEPQVRLVRKKNGGQASAFNAGIPECKGEFVLFLDGDDWWAKEKLKTVSEAFAADAGVGLIGTGILEVYADGREHTELLKDVPRFRVTSEEGARAFRLRKSFLGTSRMALRTELLKRIGTVPESLTIQADEYIFTLGAVLSDVLILREPLTIYRLHETNAFQVQDGNVTALRRKQMVLASLAKSLETKLAELGVDDGVSQTMVETIETDADLLRLSIDGGFPWETIQTELRNYRIMHENASAAHWLLKCATLLPACVLPPRAYYLLRQKCSENSIYRKAREKWLPFLQPTHVDRYRTTRP